MGLQTLIIGIVFSMLPIFELRAGIPILISGGFNPVFSLLVGFLGNIAIIFPIWFFLDYVHVHLLKIKVYDKFSHKILERMRAKAHHVRKSMEVYEWLALTILVAVPLPVTGAYTATLIVWLLELNRKKSFLAISLGVLIAALLVTLVTVGLLSLFF